MHARRSSQSGQAAVELVAVLPFVALLGLVLWQLAVAGQAAWLSGAAARAAARAEAVGGDSLAAARGVLPSRLEDGVRVRAGRDGAVAVEIGVPSVVGRARLTTIESHARFQPQA
jgi:pilus assembly protein CpaE